MTITYTSKPVPQLKAGDIVLMHGGRFEVLADARDANVCPLEDLQGPSPVAIAPARCLAGTAPGYFWPGSAWTFQGNSRSSFAVETGSAA